MQSIKSASSSGVSDLKELLDLVSKPDKLKAAIEQLEDKTKESNDAAKALREKEAFVLTKNSEAEEKLSLASELYEKASQKEKEAQAKESSANHKEADLHQREQALNSKAEDFKAYYEGAVAELLIKQGAAENQLKIAKRANEAAEELVKEYQAKVSKLQAAMH